MLHRGMRSLLLITGVVLGAVALAQAQSGGWTLTDPSGRPEGFVQPQPDGTGWTLTDRSGRPEGFIQPIPGGSGYRILDRSGRPEGFIQPTPGGSWHLQDRSGR